MPQTVNRDATDLILLCEVVDSGGDAVLDVPATDPLLAIHYRVTGGAWVAISLVPATAGTYTSGGWVHVGGGLYELGLPNPAIAAGQRTHVRLIYNGHRQMDAVDAVIYPAGPDNSAAIAAIKAKTDNLPAAPAAAGSAMTLTAGERGSIGTAVWATSTRTLTTTIPTAAANATAVWAAATRSLTTTIPTAGEIATSVWAATTRTLTSGGGGGGGGDCDHEIIITAIASARDDVLEAIGDIEIGGTEIPLEEMNDRFDQLEETIGDLEINGPPAEDIAEDILPRLLVGLQPFVIDANLPSIATNGMFTIVARDDYENGPDIDPIGPIRIQSDLPLLRETDPPTLRFGATQRLGARLGNVKFIGGAYATAVDGAPDQYDVFITLEKTELDRTPGIYAWDVEAVFPSGLVQTLFGGDLTLRASMGDHEDRTPPVEP